MRLINYSNDLKNESNEERNQILLKDLKNKIDELEKEKLEVKNRVEINKFIFL